MLIIKISIKERFSEEQVNDFLDDIKPELPIKELCLRHGSLNQVPIYKPATLVEGACRDVTPTSAYA